MTNYKKNQIQCDQMILTTASRDFSLAPNTMSALYLAAGSNQQKAFVTYNLGMKEDMRHDWCVWLMKRRPYLSEEEVFLFLSVENKLTI